MNTRIGFSTPNWFNPISWLVRKVTGSKASHTWFLYKDLDFDMEMVLEAHELGFRLVPFEHWKRFNTVVAIYTPRRPIEVGLKAVAQRFLGTRYAFDGLIGMAWVRFGSWLKRKWRNPFRDAHHVFCSEALALAMQLSGDYADFTDEPDSVDPETMRLYFERDAQKV